ncbi:MAG: phospholipase D family protein [Treponema sp.]|nr:phospholipase D family protein [Candidatus Treponema equifaecale]
MSKGLLVTVQDIILSYIDIINHATNYCIICTPYYKTIPEIEDAIMNAIKRGVKFWVFYRFEKAEQFASLRFNPSILLTGIIDLHGKAILNENEMIISSLNFTESSVDNLEFAFLTDDSDEINKMKIVMRRDCGFGLDMNDKPLDFGKPFMQCEKCKCTLPNTPGKTLCPDCYDEARGFINKDAVVSISKCKKCGAGIEPNPYKPLCITCYKNLSDEEKNNYLRVKCKGCGNMIPNNPFKPYCYDCFQKIRMK